MDFISKTRKCSECNLIVNESKCGTNHCSCHSSNEINKTKINYKVGGFLLWSKYYNILKFIIIFIT